MSDYIIYIGFLAQFFFTSRILVQWVKSERSHQIESPTLFWVLSMLGSSLLFLYGWLRNDFSIIVGELLSYYIYLWNLKAKGVYQYVKERFKGFVFLTWLIAVLPLFLVAYVGLNLSSFTTLFLKNESVPLYALIWGTVGQLIYKGRFIYQWYYSYKRHESVLPLTFWWMAVCGSLMIIIYGIFRKDIILIIGQFGIVASIRNIIIGAHQKHKSV